MIQAAKANRGSGGTLQKASRNRNGKWFASPLISPIRVYQQKNASVTSSERYANMNSCETDVDLDAEASYPFSWFAPDIHYVVKFSVKVIAKNKVQVKIKSGYHQLFPNYEGLVNGKLLYRFSSVFDGPGLFDLNKSMSITPQDTLIIDAETPCECGAK